jgi:hypothetical protein
MPTSPALAAWQARFPKGTRIRATFDLTRGDERESFELVLAGTCLVNVGPDGARKGHMYSGLAVALDGLAASYGGWKLDGASVLVEQAPGSATRAQVAAMLVPILSATF